MLYRTMQLKTFPSLQNVLSDSTDIPLKGFLHLHFIFLSSSCLCSVSIIIFHRVSYIFEKLKFKQVILCFCFWEWEWKVQRNCRRKITVKGVLEEKYISCLILLFTFRIFVFSETTCPRLSQRKLCRDLCSSLQPSALLVCVFLYNTHSDFASLIALISLISSSHQVKILH